MYACLPPNIIIHISLVDFCSMYCFSNFTNHPANIVNRIACPISPNIRPNKNGKVIMVYNPENKRHSEHSAHDKNKTVHDVPLLIVLMALTMSPNMWHATIFIEN